MTTRMTRRSSGSRTRWRTFAASWLAFTGQYEATHPQADRPLIDEASYEAWALELAGGDWLGDEIFFQEPLYPYWLGVVYGLGGPEVEARRALARRVQALLGALTSVLMAGSGPFLASRSMARRAARVGDIRRCWAGLRITQAS